MAISEPRILVAGCGALGSKIAKGLAPTARVYGLKRHPDNLPEGVLPLAADLQAPEQLAQVVPDNLDAVIYCLTPNSYDDEGYRAAFVSGLANLVSTMQKQGQRLNRLLFVSSTGVYQQDDDNWIDETSPTEPLRFGGKRLLEGEQCAANAPWPATTIRFSGIYGPGRTRFLESVINGELAPAAPSPFTNRIHEDDAAAAAVHLINRSLRGEPLEACYLASDEAPVRLGDVVQWVQTQISCQSPTADARSGRRAGSKRISNQRLLASGFRFRYPSFREGYSEMIQSRLS
ncbi:NAD-dependent epimerase/dehydratase family protein [Marinobacter sp. 1Y8]